MSTNTTVFDRAYKEAAINNKNMDFHLSNSTSYTDYVRPRLPQDK